MCLLDTLCLLENPVHDRDHDHDNHDDTLLSDARFKTCLALKPDVCPYSPTK